MTACAKWGWASSSNTLDSAVYQSGQNRVQAVGIIPSSAPTRSIRSPINALISSLKKSLGGGRGGFNRWTINGKSWPNVDPLIVKEDWRYRITMENKSGDDHPVHFHRHTFE